MSRRIVAIVMGLAASSTCGAHGAVPAPRERWLAHVVAGRASWQVRSADPHGDGFQIDVRARALTRGETVLIVADTTGTIRDDGRWHAIHIDGRGAEADGWLDARALRPVETGGSGEPGAAGAGWSGHWRSSAGLRELSITRGRASYVYQDGGSPGSRIGMLLRVRPVTPVIARLSRAEPEEGSCDLDAGRLGDYLVLSVRACSPGEGHPDAVLHRVRFRPMGR